MPKITLIESLPIYDVLPPAADSAGRTGLYTLVKFAHRASIIVHINQGSASTVLLTPLQATNEEGGSSKVLANNCQIWTNLDTATIDTFTRQADGVNYTTDAATKNKIIVFQIDPEFLDLANGFVAVGLSTGASSASNITEAVVLLETRYEQPKPPDAADLD
jgi:hypothetical protein